MPAVADLDSIASRMKSAQDTATQLSPWTSQWPEFDLPTAYAAAHRLHRMRLDEGAVAVGRKIGFTNPDMWARYGAKEPVWAYLYDTTVARLAPDSTCSLGRFAEPKIEPEIVFHFRAAPPPGGDLAAILASIDWVAHGFEIVQSHYPGWRFEAPDVVVDCTLHGTLLLGEPQPVERLGSDPVGALESFAVELSCDGELRETGRGSNVLGSPLAAVAHLIDVLAKQPNVPPLAAGEMVTTGTLTTAHSVRPGERWTTAVQGLAVAGAQIRFVG